MRKSKARKNGIHDSVHFCSEKCEKRKTHKKIDFSMGFTKIKKELIFLWGLYFAGKIQKKEVCICKNKKSIFLWGLYFAGKTQKKGIGIFLWFLYITERDTKMKIVVFRP